MISRAGGPEVLELRELPDPVPARGEVLVRVRASALNRADLLQRRGLYPAPEGAPADIPGLEFAGEVESAGPGASLWAPGARVMGIVGGGGHAGKVTVPEGLCLPVPPSLDWIEAAAVPEAFLTAHDALFDRGSLRAGECVLLHAAASGVGTAAAGIAAAAGGRVVGLSRTPWKRDRLRDLGLHAVLDPADGDIAAGIRTATEDRGVDLVVDFLGAASWSLNMEVLAPLGRLVLVGTMGGSKVSADLSHIMRRRLTVVGTVLRSRSNAEKVALATAFARTTLTRIADGTLRPVVDRVLPLERVGDAHRIMERNESFGKIVLQMD